MNRIALTTPVFNDWESFYRLLEEIDNLDIRPRAVIHVFAVDDGSVDARFDASRLNRDYRNIAEVEVLHLACNLGHQRAIAVGLSEVYSRGRFDAVIVMDSDGEDRPRDIEMLLREHDTFPQSIIAAQRLRRSEGMVFRAFYRIYKKAFRLLTGHRISFGNFCVIPMELLGHLVHSPHLWNHMAATFLRLRLPFRTLGTDRGMRYASSSKMGFSSLILHGLSAIAVYLDVALVRMMLSSIFLCLVTAAGIIAILGIKAFTALAIPGWASLSIGILSVLLLQSLMACLFFLFIILSNRSSRSAGPVEFARNSIVGRYLNSTGSDVLLKAI